MFGPSRMLAGKRRVSPPYKDAMALQSSQGGATLSDEVVAPYVCELTGLAPSEWRGLACIERAQWIGYAEGKRLAQIAEAANGRSQARHTRQR